MELGSYCNRRCPWCPNGWHQRGQRREHMKESTWRALLRDLGAARYRGWLAFHNYNEPLADPHLFDRLRQARRALPRAHLEVLTNGDLLGRVTLRQLRTFGADLVRVTLYPPPQRAFDGPDKRALRAFMRRLGLLAKAPLRDRGSKIELHARQGRMRVIVRAPRLGHFTDRAGSVRMAELISRKRRRRQCLLPIHSAAVDYHGNLKLCCHIYDTLQPSNRPYVIGNVEKVAFTRLWASPRMQSLRAKLAAADFRGLAACARCSHRPTASLVRWIKRHYPVRPGER
ncbi:MAG: radical SAM/SPASM domain-containing protein [Myxococcales bacterium]|nr:radical SAM/SPASM domain-containing protein [Myxococcales bacterium]